MESSKPMLIRSIAALSVASGICGIAYELLYARLLTTYLGDMFHVGAAILASFLFGIAVGSFAAHRLVRWLWLIEIGIGAYAVIMAIAFSSLDSAAVTATLAVAGGAASRQVLCVFLLLVLPAVGVGSSVPLFARYLEAHSPPGRDAFRSVYWLYNLGAAGSVIALEFFLLRSIGLRASLVLMAAVNCTTGLLLLRVAPPEREPGLEIWKWASRLRAPLLALAAASALSAAYQLAFFKLAEVLFGPFHENFAVVLVLVLTGLSTGTLVVGRLRPTFTGWLLAGGVLVGLSFALLAPAIYTWAALNGAIASPLGMSTLLKIGVMAGLGAVPFALLGATVPAMLREAPPGRSVAGIALGVSSLGNCFGYLATALFLYELLDVRGLAVLISAGLSAIGLALARRDRAPLFRPLLIATLTLALLVVAWPSTPLAFGFSEYASLATLSRAQERYRGHRAIRKYDTHLSIVETEDGKELLWINGYKSLAASRGGRTNRQELIFGMTPALYTTERRRALVLGIGTGITAGATATLYEAVTAVEISPAILELLPHFDTHNLGLRERANVDLRLDDGLNLLTQSEERYDTIINTVTSPLFFSSSKLYTRDFFQLAAKRLAPGGVYALWFDTRVQQRGAEVIWRSLAESFADCHVVYLSSGYCQVICGNQPLAPRLPPNDIWAPELEARLGMANIGLDTSNFLAGLIFVTSDQLEAFRRDTNIPANTFDRPLLEFLMAQRALGRGRDTWSPFDLPGLDVRRSAFGDEPLTGEALVQRCYAVRVRGLFNPCMHAMIEDNGGRIPVAYTRLALALPADSMSAEERTALLKKALRDLSPEEATELIEDSRDTMGDDEAFLALRMGHIFAQRGDLTEAEIAETFAGSPLGRGTHRLLAQIAAERGMTAAASSHLSFLRALGGWTKKDAALYEQLQRPSDTEESSDELPAR